MEVPLMRLQCGLNSYEWGKKGHSSAAARFAAATPAAGVTIEADKPYAELWMGTHPSNPSRDLKTGRTLLDMIEDNQALLTAPVAEKFGRKLPFLLKVLSIDKALSIQAHPNKRLAEQLHARDSKNYPDDNHKPEMAIAITPFEGLCGFRPLDEIVYFLRVVPPLRELVGTEAADEFIAAVDRLDRFEGNDSVKKDARKEALKSVFGALMASSQADVDARIPELVALAESQGASFTHPDVEELEDKSRDPAYADLDAVLTASSTLPELVRRLHGDFGADIGIFVLFFVNLVTLEPGEALFLAADDIHAYLSGDIIECMAASDNVVRAGLTPKFKDVDTLVDMLTYEFAPASHQRMYPCEYPYATLNRAAYVASSKLTYYDPPAEEFSVVRTMLHSGTGSRATFDPIQGPSLVICTGGRGTISVGPKTEEMMPGYVFFVGATAEIVLEGYGDGRTEDGQEEEAFVTFTAYC